MPRPSTAPRPTVLVVEDDAVLGRAISRLLSIAGFEVHLEFESPRALDRAATLRPSAIVTDVMMPEVDGGTLVRLIRENPTIAATPVVLFSALDPAALANVAHGCNATAHISKSDGIVALRNWLKNALGTS